MFTTGNSKNSTSTISSAVNGIAKATNSALGAVNTAAASTVAAVNSLATGTAKAVNSAATNAVKAVNSALPSANSLMPFANAAKNGKPANNSGKNSNIFHNAYNNFKNVGVNSLNTAANSGKTGWGMMFGLVLFLTATFLLAIFVFQNEFNTAWDYLTKTIQKLFKKDVPTNETPDDLLKEEEGNIMKGMPGESDRAAGGLLNKILPMGTKEVFNVSLNDYSYYDAEPLCLALGAELANYEQVKEAWNKGADWCNYGWTKGQLAIYPTQKDTWEKLQHGPLDEKGACGRPGVNGGYFDNPEMRFGVNCYGDRPAEKDADIRNQMMKGDIPLTNEVLEQRKKELRFRTEANQIPLNPYN